jgi:hypothetical protein
MAQALASHRPVEVSELTDERTLVTANPETGTFTAEVTAAVSRVRDGQGGWRDPDITLEIGADGQLHPKAARWPISVSSGGGADLVGMSIDGAAVGLRLPVNLPSPVVAGNTATYAEVYPGVDVVAMATPESVSTYLVVKTAEAGRNPAVRKLSFQMTTQGVAATEELPSGEAVLSDRSGSRRLEVSAAAMWDSTGKGAPVSPADRVLPSAAAEQRSMDAKVAGSRLEVAPDVNLLDDAATVYPVIIDPSINSYETNYFKRLVSNNCFSYTSTTQDGLYTGDKARVGYNGWSTSDCGSYYESQVFYRFSLPSMEGSWVKSAVFQHRNAYSPQHSPCNDANYGYPVDAGLTAAYANNATSWSQRPAFKPNPVKNNYGVGAIPTYCTDKKVISWDLTAQFHQEFNGKTFGGSTPITIGMKGDSATQKMNWRTFDNVWATGSASRPLLKVEYSTPPAAPTSVSYLPVASGKLGETASSIYTSETAPTFGIPIPSDAANKCPTTSACYEAKVQVIDTSTNTQVGVDALSPVTAAGQSARVQVSGLLQGHAYQVRGYLVNTSYGWTSASYTSLAKLLRVASANPPSPVGTADTVTVHPSGTPWPVHAALTATPTDEVVSWCLSAGSTFDLANLNGCVSSSQVTYDFNPVLVNTSEDPRGGSTQYSFYVVVCYATGVCRADSQPLAVLVQ